MQKNFADVEVVPLAQEYSVLGGEAPLMVPDGPELVCVVEDYLVEFAIPHDMAGGDPLTIDLMESDHLMFSEHGS